MKMTSAGSQYPWGIQYQDLPAQVDGAEGGGEGRRHGEREERGRVQSNAMFAECLSIQMLHNRGPVEG